MPPNFSRPVCASCRHASTIARYPPRRQWATSDSSNAGDDISTIPQALLNTLKNQLDPVTPLSELRQVLVVPGRDFPSFDTRKNRNGVQSSARYFIREAALEKKREPAERTIPDKAQGEGDNIGRIAIALAIRQQVKKCQSPQQLVRIANQAFSDPIATHEFLGSVRLLASTLYSWGDYMKGSSHQLGAKRAAAFTMHALNTILHRLRTIEPRADPAVEQEYLNLALQFSATTHFYRATWTYLREYRQRGFTMDATVFSDLCRRLEAWAVKDNRATSKSAGMRRKMLQVIFGRDDAKEPVPCHLGSWLDRSDLTSHAAWVSLLSVTKSQALLVQEWELWLASPLRAEMSADSTETQLHDTTLIYAMEPLSTSIAWAMFRQSGLRLSDLPKPLRLNMVMSAPAGTTWTPEMEKASLELLERELIALEAALGIEWVHGKEGQGEHKKLDGWFWQMEDNGSWEEQMEKELAREKEDM